MDTDGMSKSKPPSLPAAILFSLKTRSYLPNALNIAINTLLFSACLDLALNPVFYPETGVSFTRVGAVYPDAAKITVRFPAVEAVTEQDIRLLYREANSVVDTWKDGPMVSVQEKNDWVSTVRLANLWPETTYECTLLLLSPLSILDFIILMMTL